MTRKKKILQIIPTLDRSGAEKQLVLLATNLPRDEFEVEVLALTRSGPLADDLTKADVPLTRIEKRLKFDPPAYVRLKRAIRRFRPDLVHTWLFAANAYGRRAALSCGVPRIVAGERCVDPWKSWYHFFIDRRLAKKTDRIVTNSSGVKEFYVAHGIPAEKFVVIPNAVSPPNPVPEPFSRERLIEYFNRPDAEPLGDYFPVIDSRYDPAVRNYVPRSSLGPDRKTPFLIGMISRLWPQKRIKDALWVFQTLKVANFDFHAIIIGDGPERETLLRFRDDWKLSDRVHFVGHRDDVARFVPAFDVLLHTSDHEGQSNAILEAMVFGVPVIAMDIPGNRDLVVDGETGRLVPCCGADFQRQRRLFVETILAVLENAPLCEKMAAAAERRVVDEFGLDRMVSRHVELYRELCNGL